MCCGERRNQSRELHFTGIQMKRGREADREQLGGERSRKRKVMQHFCGSLTRQAQDMQRWRDFLAALDATDVKADDILVYKDCITINDTSILFT